jgi:PAS domain S-box-containing protein
MAGRRWQLQLFFLLSFPVITLVGSSVVAAEKYDPSNKIIVALPGHLPPQYITDTDGSPDGFAIDVVNRVAALANLRVEYRNMYTWPAAHTALQSGEVDIIPDMGITAERKKKFDFSLPIETFSIGMFVRSATQGVQGLDELSGKRVATVRTNIAIKMLQNHPDIKSVLYDNIGAAIFALLSSEVEALIYPEPWVVKSAQEAGVEGLIKEVGKPLAEIQRAIAVRKGNRVLLDRINIALARFRHSDEYRLIYAKWFSPPTPYWTNERLMRALEVSIGAIVMLVIFVVVWRNHSLRTINATLSRIIEERRRAEISLNEQILRNELIIQTTHDGFFIVDLEGNIKDVNHAYCDMVGYSPHELLSMTVDDLKVDKSPDETKKHAAKVIEAGSDRFETRHRRKDGQIVDLEVSVTLGEINNDRFFFSFFRDITQQKQAQLELRKSEQLWRTVVENVPDIIIMVDRQGVIQFINRLLPGFTLDKVIGSTVFDYQPEELHEQVRDKLRHVFETGETVSYETLGQGASGDDQQSIYITRIAPILSHDKVASALMLSVDVSELRQVEQALRASEERLLSITRHSPDFIMMLDREGIIHFINRTLPQLTPSQVIGKPVFDYMPKHNREHAREVLDRVAKTGNQDMYYTEYENETGGIDYFESYVGPIKKDGEVVAFTVNARNITDRRRVEMALQALACGTQSFDFTRFIHDTVQQLASVYNAKYAFAGLIKQPGRRQVQTLAVWAGDGFEENFRYDLEGTPCQDILNHDIEIIPDDAAQLYPEDKLLEEMGVRSYFGAPVISANNETIGILTVMDEKPMNLDSTLKNILGVFATRISVELDRKRSYEEVNHYREHLEELVSQRTRALELANQELESFCYSVSHDLRAPLRTIDGFSLAVMEDYQEVLDHEGVEYLTRVRNATQRMGELIDDMLSLYSVTRSEFHRQNVDLTMLVYESAEAIRMRNPEREVELLVEPDLKAEGDERLLKIVLDNLLNNAWKFTSKVEHSRIEVGKLDQAGAPTFYVKDNGAGFNMAYVNKLFGAFKRLHHEDEFEGTGVGLAIVKRIIDRHNGRVWAESEPGRGATFYFTLGE